MFNNGTQCQKKGISCDFVQEFDEYNKKQTFVNVSLENESVRIPLEEFKKVLNTKEEKSVDAGDIIVGTQLKKPNEIKCDHERLNRSNVVRFLIKRLPSINNLKNVSVLYVKSGEALFLELPWEEVSDDFGGIVIREIISEIKDKEVDISKNLLLVTSYAYEGISSTLEKELSEEMSKIMDCCIETNEIRHRINTITWLRHATCELIKGLDFTKYNFIHFAMHGYEKGGIYLSKNDTNLYKQPVIFTIDDLLKHVINCRFKLIFFSTCYSGGGLIDDIISPAIKVVQKGISDFAIGYFGGAGNTSSREFANEFYKKLLSISDIEEVYLKSMKEYKSKMQKGRKSYIPYLYKGVS